MKSQDFARQGWGRREAMKVALGSAIVGAALVAPAGRADAQTAQDIDTLNVMLNFQYLLTQFVSAATNVVVPVTSLVGDGVAGTPVIPGRAVTFGLQAGPIVREIASENLAQLAPLRGVLGVPSVRQPLIDISAGAAAPFSVAMQRAGVVAAGVAFDPYASEDNFLLALFYLKNISVAAWRGLVPTITNRVVVQNCTGFLGAEAIHSATVRSLLYTRSVATPTVRQSCDRIAAFQRSLNGGEVFQGITPASRTFAGGTAAVQVANVSPALATGDVGGLNTGRLLNQLYLTNTATTSGGFYPQGVNGTIRTSASA